jgi:hypothetical protein
MPPITAVGNELAELPFGDFLHQVARGIADGQRALDLTSLQTLIELSRTQVDLIPEITEVITSAPFQVPVSGQAPVTVSGARVQATASAPVRMSALQAGIVPTFYQFTEATMQLKLSIQLRAVQETAADGTSRASVRAFSSNVNFRTQNTFSYTAQGSSSVTAIIRPVPPPGRVVPSTITVNTLTSPTSVLVQP